MPSDMSIIFNGINPVDSTEFLKRMKSKCAEWEEFVVPLRGEWDRLSPLEATWNMNCKALNNAINDNKQNVVMKYVVSAPTGSAKTESFITYCSILPDGYTAIIATNLTDEADKIADKINMEAEQIYKEMYYMATINGKHYIPEYSEVRAYSYHSKIPKDKALDIQEVAKFQIIVTTHSFYKNHYFGTPEWLVLAEKRDLVIIDEALETMQEISVKDEEIRRAITVFSYLAKQSIFKNNQSYVNELSLLEYELKALENVPEGTVLFSVDNTWSVNGQKIMPVKKTKYQLFSEILGEYNYENSERSKKLKKFGRAVDIHKILIGRQDKSNNDILRKELIQTIRNLNLMDKIGQVYTTASGGHRSFNRVKDMMFKKSLVCFDATAEVNDIYKLRSKYYNDLHLIPKHPNVRDYSNVALHTISGPTSKDVIDTQVVATALANVILGEKTLIITNKKNKALFLQEALNSYPNKIIEVAHWNAITGLNKWKDFDTCIIVGLNNKPKSFAQNILLIGTGSEAIAFGEDQNTLNTSIEDSAILAEIIQAMNRIRIRTIKDHDGSCESANIYLVTPYHKEALFRQQIKGQMPNIQIKDWNVKLVEGVKEVVANFDVLVQFLDDRLKSGESISKKEVLEATNINADSFRTMIGKPSQPSKVKAFRDNLRKAGFETIESKKEGRKTTDLYFRKI